MSTIDTSTWSPDSDLNVNIGGIPLNADASIQQTWQAIQMLMAALKGDTSDIKLTINQPDGTTIVATNQTLTVVDNSHAHTIANVTGLQTALDGKANDGSIMHLSGAETAGGVKTFSDGIKSNGSITRSFGGGVLQICGGNGVQDSSGGRIDLYGGSASTPGLVRIVAGTSAGAKKLLAAHDGTLTWDGQAIQTASDERLKTPLATMPDEVLDAWGDVQWGQFQFLDAVERKGEAARLHLGLIAQRVKVVFEARGLDACAYGILCHEERKATEKEPAIDLWMIRYTEALAMEAAFQRRRADRLEERIVMLEEKTNG